MPATIVVTMGNANANAYCTADEANDYLDDIYGADEWVQLSNDDKERLILTAAKQIDRLDIQYDKASAEQAMKFPVTGCANNGFSKVAEANILQAFYLFLNSDAMTDSNTGAMQGTKSETLGPTNRQSIGFNRMLKLSPDVLKLLAPFVSLSFRTRGVR